MHVCERLVEEVKRTLPMWKQQFESDGTYRWSGL
jgi:molybdopterin synthase catalytic subunit